MRLSPQQAEAYHHDQGPALVLAVPGAGKTTVLLHRLIRLMEEEGIKSQKLLTITFSKNQILDMENRFSQLRPNKNGKDRPNFSTIHAFSYEILRYYLKNHHLQKTLIEGKGHYNKYKMIHQIYYEVFKDYLSIDKMESFFLHYSKIKNKLLSVEEYMKNIKIPHEFKVLFEEYEKRKEVHHLMDFEDMLVLTNDLLDKDPKIRNHYQNKYDYIQVDEAQDTSPVQIEIIKKISYRKKNLLLVADDDQSIYSFRGATPEYLLDFKNQYPEGKIYYIEENFRSTPSIIRLADYIISKNKARYKKEIYTSKIETTPIRLIKAHSQAGTLEFLRDELKTKVSSKETVALLYRNNISSLALSYYLGKEGFTFSLKGNYISFLDHFLLRDLYYFYSFSKYQNSESLFEKIYYKLGAYINKKQFNMLATYPDTSPILDRLLDNLDLENYQIDRLKKVKKSLHKIANLSFSEAIELIMEDLEYYKYLKKKSNLDDLAESYGLMLESYKYIFGVCHRPEEVTNRIQELKERMTKYRNSPSKITLSTIHRAKGLEYDRVYLLDLVDGEFPSYSNDLQLSERIAHSEEERRLFYVGMTRAKENLILITNKTRNGERVQSSKYYEEIKNHIRNKK